MPTQALACPAYARHVNTFYQNSSPHRPTSPAPPLCTRRLLCLALEKDGTIRASRDTIPRVLRSRPIIAPNSETRQARIARGACIEKWRRFPDRRRGDVRTRAMLVSSLWPVRLTAPIRPSGLRAYDTAKIACFSPLRRAKERPSPTTRLPPPQSRPSTSMLCRSSGSTQTQPRSSGWSDPSGNDAQARAAQIRRENEERKKRANAEVDDMLADMKRKLNVKEK